MSNKNSDLVKKALQTLEKGYGTAALLPGGDHFDQLIYLIIEGVAGAKSAEAGVQRLKKAFVDWNEVRVSGRREIENCLSDVPKEDRRTLSSHILQALDRVFEARYREELVLGRIIEDYVVDRSPPPDPEPEAEPDDAAATGDPETSSAEAGTPEGGNTDTGNTDASHAGAGDQAAGTPEAGASTENAPAANAEAEAPAAAPKAKPEPAKAVAAKKPEATTTVASASAPAAKPQTAKVAESSSDDDGDEDGEVSLIDQIASDDPNDQLEFMTSVEGLDQGRAALVLLSCYPDVDDLLPFAAIGRILSRMGVMKKASTCDSLRRNVGELLDRSENVRLTYLLARHGHEVCGAKSYYCAQCAIVKLCEMGKRRVKSTKAPAKTAATKKTAKKTTKKTPTKTATKKTATKKTATKKTATKKAAAKVTKKKAPSSKTAKKVATKKAPAKKTPAKKTAKKTASKKTSKAKATKKKR